MAPVDNATWQALGLTLTLLGLVVSFLVWRRRGPAAGVRGVAWSLIPLAAALTGTLRLGWQVADAVVDWSVRLVFSPVVWLGVSLAVLSGVLFVVSGVVRSRSPRSSRSSSRSSSTRSAAGSPAGTRAVEPTRGSNAAGGTPDDLDDIEALLKKHGIE